MFWATRLLNVGGDIFIRELFEAQRVALNNPRDMMLIAINSDFEQRRFFVGVPDVWLLDDYFGFEPCLKRNLPLAPTLISGHHDVFQILFS